MRAPAATRHLSIRVPEGLHEQLRRRAEREDRSVSAVVRRVLIGDLRTGLETEVGDGDLRPFEGAARAP